jgi:hypothetical protein
MEVSGQLHFPSVLSPGRECQAVIKALGKYHITSKLVWDYHQSLIQLAKHNRVQLIRVPGYEGTVGKETADQLARTGSEHPLTGPETACGISIGVAKKAITDWTKKKKMGISDWNHTGIGIYTRAICLNNEGSVGIK